MGFGVARQASPGSSGLGAVFGFGTVRQAGHCWVRPGVFRSGVSGTALRGMLRQAGHGMDGVSRCWLGGLAGQVCDGWGVTAMFVSVWLGRCVTVWVVALGLVRQARRGEPGFGMIRSGAVR